MGQAQYLGMWWKDVVVMGVERYISPNQQKVLFDICVCDLQGTKGSITDFATKYIHMQFLKVDPYKAL